MAENSKIEWTHHTFNPWIGCWKISPECENCYAAVSTFTRFTRSKGKELWGRTAERHLTSESNWKQPLNWNRKAKEAGERHRVFCASLADVFERHPDAETDYNMDKWRFDLFNLILATPHLDWLLLTKRPENVMSMIPHDWRDKLPQNIWIGTSVGTQKSAEQRISHLLQIPARVRFLSCEPLLEQVDLTRVKAPHQDPEEPEATFYMNAFMENGPYTVEYSDGGNNLVDGPMHYKVDWVIAGAESGHGARPMHPDWPRKLRDDCKENDVPFLFKQWGEHAMYDRFPTPVDHMVKVKHYWENEQFVAFERGTPAAALASFPIACRVGKREAGRLLDGKLHNEFPPTLIRP